MFVGWQHSRVFPLHASLTSSFAPVLPLPYTPDKTPVRNRSDVKIDVCELASPARSTAKMADIEPAHIISSLRTLLPDSGASDETKIEAASLLWDISADAALAALLVDHSAVPLLLRNLSDAGSSARLCEVSAGALANLAADPNVRTALVQHVDAPAVLGRVLLESADAATLFESVRVFQNVFLSHGTSGSAADDPWLTLLCEQHVDKLLFILLNTLRDDLCERTAALLSILARSEATCAIFLRSQSSMSSVFAALLERWRAGTNEGDRKSVV